MKHTADLDLSKVPHDVRVACSELLSAFDLAFKSGEPAVRAFGFLCLFRAEELVRGTCALFAPPTDEELADALAAAGQVHSE